MTHTHIVTLTIENVLSKYTQPHAPKQMNEKSCTNTTKILATIYAFGHIIKQVYTITRVST
jgi:hypothetical protein